MEFLTPKQKQRRTRQLYIGYALLSLLAVLLTYVLVSTARGFVLFSRDGDLKQNGLLFLSSDPADAEVFVNGKKETAKTNSRLSLEDGVYTIEFRKEGFRTWTKSVELQGGQVVFLTYPKLTPVQVESAILGTNLDFSPTPVQSRDKRWAIVPTKDSFLAWEIYDLERIVNRPTPFSIPAALFDESTAPITGAVTLEWAGDNTHMLFRYAHQDGRRSFVVCSRNDASACQNISTVFGVSTEVRLGFWDGKWDQFYHIDSSGTMKKGDLKSAAFNQQPIATNVTGMIYLLTDARFLYASQLSATESVVKLVDGQNVVTIGTYPGNATSIKLSSAGFNSNEYVVVGGSDLQKTYIYKNPKYSNQVKGQKISPSVLVPISSEKVSFSNGNRFIMAADKEKAFMYDIEKKMQSKSSLKQEGQNLANVDWLDSSRIYTRYENGDLYMQDYDGSNRSLLLSSTTTIPKVTEDGYSMLVYASAKSVVNVLGLTLNSPAE